MIDAAAYRFQSFSARFYDSVKSSRKTRTFFIRICLGKKKFRKVLLVLQFARSYQKYSVRAHVEASGWGGRKRDSFFENMWGLVLFDEEDHLWVSRICLPASNLTKSRSFCEIEGEQL